MRDPFKKLLNNCKSNSLYQKPDGTWTINSSTNRRRMLGTGNGVGGAPGPNQKDWKPAKLLITEDDLKNQWKLQDEKCFWFSIPLDFGLLEKKHPDWSPKHPMAPSVDRKDDSKDYTPDNIVICCRFANLGRNIYPFDKTKVMIDKIKESLRESPKC